jgi:hypothetical protein
MAATVGMGCLLLNSCAADTKTTAKDAGLSVRDTSPSPDPTYDPYPTPTTTTTTPLPDAGPVITGENCDTALDLTRIHGCNQFTQNARACADNNSFAPYPFTDTRTRDVVTCNTNATCVQHCATQCAHLPNGFPDECDHCQGKLDGTYCGSEMTSWQAKSTNVLLHCRGGIMETSPVPEPCAVRCTVGTTQGTSRCTN